MFAPFRVYYRVMRWLFGKNYNPYETDVQEGLHPVPVWLKKHDMEIRVLYYAPVYVIRSLAIGLLVAAVMKIISKLSYSIQKKID